MKKRILFLTLIFLISHFSFAQSIYVTDVNTSELLVIDGNTNNLITSIFLGSPHPYGVAVCTGCQKVFVSDGNNSTVYTIDPQTNTTLNTLTVGNGSGSFSLAVTPDCNKVYVTNGYDNSVSVVNIATNTVTATISVGDLPQGIVINPNGTRAYVANSNSNTISVINTITDNVIATIPVGNLPQNIAITSNGNKVLVANGNSDNVSIIDASSNIVISNIPVGDYPCGIAINNTGTQAYIGNLNSIDVSCINLVSNVVTNTISMSSMSGVPETMMLSPNGNTLYMVGNNANFQVYDIPSNILINGPALSGHAHAFGVFLDNTNTNICSNIATPIYQIPNDTLNCAQLNCCPTCSPKVCIPLEATNTVATGIIGMDFCMNYDPAYMTPTGVVTLGDVVLNGDPNAGYYINYALTPGELHVSVYYNGQASPNAEFVGMGEVACVEFSMSANFVAGVTVPVKLCQVLESHLTSVEDMAYLDGSITLVNDDILDVGLVYWNRNNSPLSYDNANPMSYNPTNISGADGNCNLTGLSTVQPDLNGNFQHNINNGTHLSFSRDIACGKSVMNTINGMDCYWTSLITTQNPSFVPSAFQIVSADVSLDGTVSAGDITQIQRRIVLANGYDCNYIQTGGQTLDWVFTDSTTVFNDWTWQVSPNYPAGGAGYSYNNLPNLVPCLKIKTDSNGVYCTTVPYMKYHGILLGDVNGTWDPTPPNASTLKTESTDKIIFDLTQATKNADCSINIPIFYQSNGNLMALDFDMDFDQTKVSNLSISNMLSSVMNITSNTYSNDRFLFSSYSTVTGGTSTNNYVYLLKVKPISGTIINAADLGSITGYLNGANVSVDIIGTSADCEKLATGITEVSAGNVSIFPNPMQNELVVEYPAEARIQNIELYDIQGRKLVSAKANATGQTILNTKELSNGVYLLQIDGKVMHKVVK